MYKILPLILLAAAFSQSDVYLSFGDVDPDAGTMEIYMVNPTPVYGFQFNISNLDNLTGSSGGSAQSNGFITSTSSSGLVLGFSLTGTFIHAGEGVLTVLAFDGIADLEAQSCYTNPLFSGPGGAGLTVDASGCWPEPAVPGCMDDTACNYNPDATEDDESCLYFDCNDDCGGTAYISECGCVGGATGLDEDYCLYPDVPQNLTATGLDGQIALDWDAVDENGNRADVTVFISSVTDNNIEIYMQNDVGVYGFQFNILSDEVLAPGYGTASGGSAAANGLISSTNASGLVLGFSLFGGFIPAGEGVLTNISWTPGGIDGYVTVSNGIISGPGGSQLSVGYGDPFCYGECPEIQVVTYNIYRDENLLIEGVSENNYIDDGLGLSESHCYNVTAFDGTYESEFSNDACATTDPHYGCTDMYACNYNPDATEDDGSCEYLPPPPTNLVVLGGNNEISLNWSGSESGSFNIYRDGELLQSGLTSPTYLDTGLGYSEFHCYTVTAYNGICESGYSNFVCATTDALLGCMDENAMNYNPDATEDDGSCLYDTQLLTFNPESLDFGEIEIGESSSRQILLGNSSVIPAEVVHVDNIISSSSDFSIFPTSFDVWPGALMPITITYLPTLENGLGEIFESLTIISNDPGTSEYLYNLYSYTVAIPHIGLEPILIQDTILPNQVLQHELSIHNSGYAPLDWLVGIEGDWLSTDQSSGSVDTVSTDTIILDINSDNLSYGIHTGYVHIYSNDPDFPLVSLMVEIDVLAPHIEVSVTELEVQINLSQTSIGELQFEITNIGFGPLIGEVNLSGHTWLSINEPNFTLYDNESLMIQLNIDGTGLIMGDYYAFITIESNAPNQPQIEVPLHLQVVHSNIELSQLFFDLGQIEFQETGNGYLMIGNTGTYDLSVSASLSIENQFELSPELLSIEPDSQAILHVSFSSEYVEGDYYNTVEIETNDPYNPIFSLPVHVEVVPNPYPVIQTIRDVPNDQGGWVIVDFTRSLWDTTPFYDRNTESYTLQTEYDGQWISVGNTIAYNEEIYSILAHTFIDSSDSGSGMQNYRVLAGMNEGTWVSEVVGGYSVDNIMPEAPRNLELSFDTEFIHLEWEDSTDDDFHHYSVYRNDECVSATTNPEFSEPIIEAHQDYLYYIKAVDIHDNFSTGSNTQHVELGFQGDVNLDGALNIVDLVAFVDLIISGEYSEFQLWAGDFNEDGNLNVVDLVDMVWAIIDGVSREDYTPITETSARVVDGTLSIGAKGEIAGIQLLAEGNYIITGTNIPVGWEMYHGEEKIIILSVDGSRMDVECQLDYIGQINFSEILVVDWFGNSNAPSIEVIPCQVGFVSIYPNPFNPRTSIAYYITEQTEVSIDVFNLQGRLICNLVSEIQSEGIYTISWNAVNETSGIYLIKLTLGTYEETRKIILVK